MNRLEFEERFVKEALSWRGVRFLHNGRSRKFGVDCLGLIVNIYRNLNFPVPDGDGKVYAYSWALHIENERYLDGLLANGVRINSEDIKVGDILFFRVRNKYVTHGGLALDSNGKFINAIEHRGVVIINTNDNKFWKKAFAGALRPHLLIKELGE